MTTSRPAAYVRKSHREAASAAAQLESIKELAIRQGVTTPLEVYADVGLSGRRGKRGAKSEWRRLHEAIESGAVTVVYVTALDRAGRSLIEWLQFTELCVAKGVEVRDQSGQNRADGDSEDIAIIEMMMAQREGRKAVERSARGRTTQARRGDEVYQGHPPYGFTRVRASTVGMVTADYPDPDRIVQVPNPDEPMAPLLDAIRDTRGNVLQAVRLLNAASVPTRSGKPWDSRVLTRALDRQGAIRTKRGPHSIRRAPSEAPLSRLVECHCGTLMTPTRDRRTGAWASLYCSRGHKTGVDTHGRYVARSRHVLDALRREVPRTSSIAIVRSSPDTSARRSELEADRERLGWAVADGLLTREQAKARLAKVTTELDELTDVENDWIGFGPKIPNVDWDGDDTTLGESLRRIVRAVRLGEDMMPVAVELTAPMRARVSA